MAAMDVNPTLDEQPLPSKGNRRQVHRSSPWPAARWWAGFWRLADPKISLASMASLFLGAAVARHDGPLAPGWLTLTVGGIFCLEVAKNASGEIFDFDSGTDLAVAPVDRSPFSGGKRVLVDGLLTRRETAAIAAVGYALAIVAGLLIVLSRSPAVLWLGAIGVACAYFYHAPPIQLSYRGLGELAVGLCYGPLICTGTYLVQRGAVAPGVVLSAIPLGLLIAAFLWIDEFPDYAADLQANKRTLVVRMGRRRARRVFVGIVGAAFGMLLLLPLGGVPWPVWLGGLGLPFSVAAARILWRHPEETARLIPAQGLTLLAFLVYAVGAGAGWLLSGSVTP
jgi:1,4-dihydroxy-2-naphthoate octaprenyltransferase